MGYTWATPQRLSCLLRTLPLLSHLLKKEEDTSSSLPSTGNPELNQPRLPGARAGCMLYLHPFLPGQELPSFQSDPTALSSVII